MCASGGCHPVCSVAMRFPECGLKGGGDDGSPSGVTFLAIVKLQQVGSNELQLKTSTRK